MDTKTINVPPPADEEPISYIYNAGTQAVHKWPGCYVVSRRMSEYSRGITKRPRFEYWAPSEYRKATQERGAIRRCRLCFGKPT